MEGGHLPGEVPHPDGRFEAEEGLREGGVRGAAGAGADPWAPPGGGVRIGNRTGRAWWGGVQGGMAGTGAQGWKGLVGTGPTFGRIAGQVAPPPSRPNHMF